ncbi:MAG: hypothetical protein DMG40_12210 [Acidobacteria bacterium]|nr:MAG: hypothetical protein DMG40_12210 [Acidobacteriota bacterium]
MSPGTSYTGKPVRRLKLPKIGAAKTTSLFEEYFYILLAMLFFAVAILGKAGGFSTYNAAVVAAWIATLIWFVRECKGYFAEKSKTENGKAMSTPAPAPAARQAAKRPLLLPPGMKPMIGPQWPVKPGARPGWPKFRKQRPEPEAQKPVSQTPVVGTSSVQTPPNQAPGTNSNEKKRAFVYERPTLPGRSPKLPNNWVNPEDKKPNNKKPRK